MADGGGGEGRAGGRAAVLALLVLAAGCTVSPAVRAANGLNLIGFGTASGALGGADVALARDTTVINANPAGLAGVGRRADAYFTAAYALGIGHADAFGNDRGVDNLWTLLGGGGYVQRLGDGAWHAGIGVFAQAGSGGVYKDLVTAFGSRDEFSSLFGVGRIVPALAWRASEALSFGAALALNRVEGRSRVFPDTSVVTPGGAFFGYAFEGLADFRPTLKLGLQFAPQPGLTLGLAYATRTAFKLEGERMVVNLRAVGLGQVAYRDVRFEGLALPRQLEVGAAWWAGPRTLMTVELAWLEWSRAMRRATLRAADPDSPLAPPSLVVTSALDWRNQTALAIGLEYAASDRLRLRVGFNYARAPAPARTIQPVLAAIHERHLTGGLAYDVDANTTLSAAFEWQPGNRVTYTNPELPFGANTLARNRYLGLTVMAGYRWR